MLGTRVGIDVVQMRDPQQRGKHPKGDVSWPISGWSLIGGFIRLNRGLGNVCGMTTDLDLHLRAEIRITAKAELESEPR
jgi:hypothetical protein